MPLTENSRLHCSPRCRILPSRGTGCEQSECLATKPIWRRLPSCGHPLSRSSPSPSIFAARVSRRSGFALGAARDQLVARKTAVGGPVIYRAHRRRPVWGESDFDWQRTTALPGNFRGQFKQESLYIDPKWAKGSDDLSLRHSQFRAALLDLAAPWYGKRRMSWTAKMCGTTAAHASWRGPPEPRSWR